MFNGIFDRKRNFFCFPGFSPKKGSRNTTMRVLRSLSIHVVAGAWLCCAALLCAPVLLCGSTLQAQQFAPAVRIVDKIDESNLVTLKGNTHPSANAKNDRGRVSPSLPMTDLILVLSRSPEQQAAFDKFVASQYDSSSPNFHQWLTPEQVGANFGPSQTDIATISNWLTGHGFSVDEVTKDRMSIRFSGTAAQVESAFHTEIHNLAVKGAAHIGNMSDPQIPAALSPAMVGVKALHNFFPRPLHRMGSQVKRDSKTGKWQRIASSAVSAEAKAAGVRPLFGISVPAGSDTIPYLVEDVAPYDFATIYNVLPLWNASTPIDGTGQIIAIAGTSSINLSDVSTFRTTFGLPTSNSYNTPILQSGNSEPLTICTDEDLYCSLDDLIENSLDVEWSGSIAKNAQIVLVSSYTVTATDDGLFDSESYIVNNVDNAASPVYHAHIMNVSYGECELGMGTGGNVEYYDLWQTAYAEGIAVFVAAGDSGAASCDDGGDENGNPYSAQYGLSVSGLASTPFDTAVGGTDFNWCPLTTIFDAQTTTGTPPECTASPYWNTTNASSGSSVDSNGPQMGYIREVPWNDTCSNPLALGYLQDWASYFSYSSPADAETACNFVEDNYVTLLAEWGMDLSWMVDTIGGSGGASNCVVNDTDPTGTNFGTCTATAGAGTTGAANGSIPTYNNGWVKPSWQTGVTGIPSDGVRDIPDVSFFAANGFLGSSYLICVSEVAPCTYLTDSEPFALEVGGTSVATPAMAGVMALINQKTGSYQGNPNTEIYRLAANQSYSSCSAESVKNSGSCYFNDIDTGTIAMPCSDGAAEGGIEYDSLGNPVASTPYLGLISPNCKPTESYEGFPDTVGILSGNSATVGYDMATGLGSLNVANVVNGFEGIGSHPATVTVTPASGSITANQSLNVTVTVTSDYSSGGTPTGTVTLTSGSYNSGPQTLAASGSCTAAGCTITIPGDTLGAGVDIVVTAYYSGDSTYSSESNTATVTVTKLTPGMSISAASNLDSNYPLPVTVTMSASGTDTTLPSGTVTLSTTNYNSGLVYVNASTGIASFTIPANTFTSSENLTLSASYSGDASYNTDVASTSVAVTYVPVLMPTVTVAPASSTLNSNASLNVTATVTGTSTSETAPTGTVTLTSGSYNSGPQTLAASGSCTAASCAFTIPANSLSGGTDTLTVTYSGDPFYYSNTGMASVTVRESSFTLAATTPAPISTPGGSATSTISATAVAGYTGTATLTTCTLTGYTPGDEYLPTCSISNGTNVAMGGTATATVNTTAASSELVYPKVPGKGKGWEGAGGGAVLAFLLFLGIPARRRSWRSMLGVLVLMVVLGSLAGCGGGGSITTGNSGTTPGNYIFTVTATGTPSVTPAPTTSFTVTVQ